MNKTVGFIGAGKMASAIIKGLLDSELFTKEQLCAAEINSINAQKAEQEFGIKITDKADDVVKNTDIIVIATKPFAVKELLEKIKPYVTEKQIIISIAAGISTHLIESALEKNVQVIKVMPNTPALLGTGMSAVCKGKYATDETLNLAIDMFSKLGKAIKCEEKDIDAITGVSGSGPAFYYYIINEIARAGEKLGLDYKTSLTLSAQTALGAAKMILETGLTPEELITNVTTPGGTTAEGNKVLNESDISKVLHETVRKTAEKSEAMAKEAEKKN